MIFEFPPKATTALSLTRGGCLCCVRTCIIFIFSIFPYHSSLTHSPVISQRAPLQMREKPRVINNSFSSAYSSSPLREILRLNRFSNAPHNRLIKFETKPNENRYKEQKRRRRRQRARRERKMQLPAEATVHSTRRSENIFRYLLRTLFWKALIAAHFFSPNSLLGVSVNCVFFSSLSLTHSGLIIQFIEFL